MRVCCSTLDTIYLLIDDTSVNARNVISHALNMLKTALNYSDDKSNAVRMLTVISHTKQ